MPSGVGGGPARSSISCKRRGDLADRDDTLRSVTASSRPVLRWRPASWKPELKSGVLTRAPRTAMFNAPSRGWRPRRGSRFGCDARQAGRSAADALYPTSELRVLLRSAPVDENQGDLHGVSAVPVTRCAFGTSRQARTRGQTARPLFGFNQATETPFTQTARLGHAEIAMHRGFMHSAIVLVCATFESDRRHLRSDKPVSGEDDRYAPWSVDREVMDDRAVRDHERVDPVRQSTNQFPVLLQGDRIAGTDCSDQLRAFPAALRATVASPSPSAAATAILQRIPMVRPERVDQSATGARRP